MFDSSTEITLVELVVMNRRIHPAPSLGHKMGTAVSSDTWISVYQSMQRHIQVTVILREIRNFL